MVNIEFLIDKNGRQQVVDLINELTQKSTQDDNYKQLSHMVLQAFDYLYYIGVPPSNERDYIGERLDGSPITLANIVKELTYHPPLLELR